jgi:hypothetical protein
MGRRGAVEGWARSRLAGSVSVHPYTGPTTHPLEGEDAVLITEELFVGGEWLIGSSRQWLDVVSPTTEKPFGRVVVPSFRDLDRGGGRGTGGVRHRPVAAPVHRRAGRLPARRDEDLRGQVPADRHRDADRRNGLAAVPTHRSTPSRSPGAPPPVGRSPQCAGVNSNR